MAKTINKIPLLEKRIGLRWLLLLTTFLIGVGYAIFYYRNIPKMLPASSNVQNIISHLPNQKSTPLLKYEGQLTPPTNHWFTPLITSFPTSPAYGYPLATAFTKDGLGLSVPVVESQPNVVLAPYRAVLNIGLPNGFNAVTAIDYDALSVNLRLNADKKTLGTVRITQGSPYVFASINKDINLTLSAKDITCHKQAELQICRLTTAQSSTNYALVLPQKQWSVDTANGLITLHSKEVHSTFAAFAAPIDSNLNDYIAASQNPIEATSVAFQQSSTGFLTTLNIKTKTGAPTLFALLPHQNDSHNNCLDKKHLTLYGTQSICQGTHFQYQTIHKTIADSIDLSDLKSSQKQQLKASLSQDVLHITTQAQDTYFGGKEVYQIAQLYDLSVQLGSQADNIILHDRLQKTLTTWFELNGQQSRNSKYFYYDPTLKTIVGAPNSFGAERLNDHHFHYGYIIAAAAVLARHDTNALSSDNKAFVDALVEDITAVGTTKKTSFDSFRYFDPYVGHSWASGLSNYADGNNQESSSEAVNAWYGVYLWSQASHNSQLGQYSSWLMSQESASAVRYWLQGPATIPNSSYTPSIYSLVWGGKREFATFFSDAPEAKYGIQLLPVNPGSGYITNNSVLTQQLLDAIAKSTAGKPIDQFNDYFTMLEATVNPIHALQQAISLPDNAIDSANSRTYMLAWIFSKTPRS